MAAQRNIRRALAWQAVLICLPIALLAGLGAFYLRQDRLLVRHEAEERARGTAREITDRVWRGLTNFAGASEGYAFRIDEAGGLVSPPPYEKAPTPRPFDLSKLTPEQDLLWIQRESGALGRLLESDLPPEAEAMASYRRALALAAENKMVEAGEAFRTVYQKFSGAVSEAGLPVALLGGLKAVELGETQSLNWDTLCRRALAEPSALTPIIFERAARVGALPASRLSEYRQQWETHEVLRELYRASRDSLGAASAAPIFWIHNGGERWLASRINAGPTNHWIVCRPMDGRAVPAMEQSAGRSELRAMRAKVGLKRAAAPAALTELAEPLATLPDYLGLSVVAASEPVMAAPNAPVLAAAVHTENGKEWLRVSLHLISPDALFARQGQRVLWFGGLIAASSLAAAIGLMSAWRSFEKQHRLAELKDNFVSSVSHELRAPIASVRLMAEGLERGRVQDPQKQQEYYHFIVQECQRLSALIQNVLDFSRIDQGRKEYEFEAADVLRLVDETIKAMDLSAAERQIRLRLRSGASAVNAVVDARALQQALINLIDNAIKHSPPGSEVTVAVATQNSGGRPLLELSVEDHGEGIPKSEHERIFERFYRIGSELRRQTPGAGIGLSIVQHIVAAHGGQVRVDSEPGQGSRFTIQIPLKG